MSGPELASKIAKRMQRVIPEGFHTEAEGAFIRFLADNVPRESGTWACELADRYHEPQALAQAAWLALDDLSTFLSEATKLPWPGSTTLPSAGTAIECGRVVLWYGNPRRTGAPLGRHSLGVSRDRPAPASPRARRPRPPYVDLARGWLALGETMTRWDRVAPTGERSPPGSPVTWQKPGGTWSPTGHPKRLSTTPRPGISHLAAELRGSKSASGRPAILVLVRAAPAETASSQARRRRKSALTRHSSCCPRRQHPVTSKTPSWKGFCPSRRLRPASVSPVAGDDPVNNSDPTGLCWSLAPGVYGPCTPPPEGVPYDGSFTVDEIAQYPQVLKGLDPDEVIQALGPEGVPSNAYVGPAGSSSAGQGPGWKLNWDGPRGNVTIRWSPGSARSDHPSEPYWKVSSGEYGTSERIPAGNWENRPEEYGGPQTPPRQTGDEGNNEDNEENPCLAGAVYRDGVLVACGAPDLGGPGNDEGGGEGEGGSWDLSDSLSYTVEPWCDQAPAAGAVV